MKTKVRELEWDHVSSYKRQIMNYLDRKQRIVELCGGTYGTSLAGKKFFPYEYLPGVIEQTSCNVCFDISTAYDQLNSTLTQVEIWFFIMCHVDCATMKNEPGLRYDLIAEEITRDFADSDWLGIGHSQLVYNKPYIATNEMRGRALNICVYDISPGLYNRRAESFI